MTDLEMTKACAEAMGFEIDDTFQLSPKDWPSENERNYWPLTNDAQAMALVKKFELWIQPPGKGHLSKPPYWFVAASEHAADTRNSDLNRCICEVVAKMQKAKCAS